MLGIEAIIFDGKRGRGIRRTLGYGLVVLFALSSPSVWAIDEVWSQIQLQNSLGANDFLLSDVIYREQESESRAPVFTRLHSFWLHSLGERFGARWQSMFGVGYFHFYGLAPERRLSLGTLARHPMGSVAIVWRNLVEARDFVGDPQTYLRIRERIQVEWAMTPIWVPTVFNEIMYTPRGGDRSSGGFSENRFAYGLQFRPGGGFQLAAYLLNVAQRTRNGDLFESWAHFALLLQFQ